MEHDHECPACREADKLGLNEEQSDLFHALVDAELEVSNAMHDMEEAGVDMDGDTVEDALMAAITSIFERQESRTLN